MEVLKGKRIVALLVVVVLIGGGGWWYLQQRRPQIPAEAAAPSTVAVTKGSIKMAVAGEGIVDPGYREEIKADNQGIIHQLHLVEGSKIRKGDPIALLVDETAQDSNTDLRLQVEKLELTLKQQQKDLSKMQQDLKNLTVTAPISGEISSLQVAKGQNVGGNAVIATIIQPDLLELTVPYNQAQVKNITAGQNASIFIQEFLTNVSGKVTKVATAGRSSGGGGILYDVTLELPNPGALYAGQEASARIITGQGELLSVGNGKLRRTEGEVVRNEVSGTVKNLSVEEGQKVQQGDKLLEIDSQDLLDQIAAKELQIKQSQLDLDSRSPKQVEFQIFAPATGTVSNVSVTQGEEIKGGQVLGEIVDYDHLQVVVPIDEMDISKVSAGQKVNVTATALSGKNFQGEVSEIATEGKAQGGVATFDITVDILNPGELKVGMNTQVEITVAAKDNILLLPVTAVQQRQGKWAVRLAGGNGRDSWQEVQVGLADDRNIEIVSGLKEGQEIQLPDWNNTSSQNSNQRSFGSQGGRGLNIPSGGQDLRVMNIPSGGNSGRTPRGGF